MQLPAGWALAGRGGYVGSGRARRQKANDRLFGSGNWQMAHVWQNRVIDRTEALALYEEAYFEHFSRNPEVVDWLCRTASEVYDLAPSNVESGEDYARQECTAVHLQDIAVRRCLRRLSRRFEGDHLVQIRGHDSEGYRLNPGVVPFHDPSGILRPSLAPDNWWETDSIEDFWQSNKVFLVRTSVPDAVMKGHLFQDMRPCPAGATWIAVFGGSFNPIHLGHLRIAYDLLDLYGFAKVIFVPNGTHYRKAGLIDEEARARMVELAIAGEPRLELCRHELGRGEKVAYSMETVSWIQGEQEKLYKDCALFAVRGSETIPRMLRWQSLPGLVRWPVIVPVRPGYDPWDLLGHEQRFRLYHDQFLFMRREYEDGLSSTIVRDRARQSLPLRGLVPPAVESYVLQQGLYCKPEGGNNGSSGHESETPF